MQQYERDFILRAIKATDSLVEAAALLGLSKQNLNYKLHKLGIGKEETQRPGK